jgi:YD repeat-containing protein
VVEYGYDAVGNRVSLTINGVTTTSAFDAGNRLTASGSVSYGYDHNGHLSSKTDGGVTTTYAYDALNRLAGWQSRAQRSAQRPPLALAARDRFTGVWVDVAVKIVPPVNLMPGLAMASWIRFVLELVIEIVEEPSIDVPRAARS